MTACYLDSTIKRVRFKWPQEEADQEKKSKFL